MSSHDRLLAIFVWSLVLPASSPAPGAVYQSESGGGWREVEEYAPGMFHTVVWHTPAGAFPTAGDSVLIRNGHDVSFSASEACSDLTVQPGTVLSMRSHSVSVTGHSSLDNVILKSTGKLANSGRLTLSGTTFEGVDALTGMTLENEGSVVQTGSNTCQFTRSVILNQAAASYEFQGDADVNVKSPGRFENRGTLLKSAGMGASHIKGFTNAGGEVHVSSGILELEGAGAPASSNGLFRVSAGAVLDLTGGGTTVYHGTYTGGGTGTIRVASGEMRCGKDGDPAVFDLSHDVFVLSGGRVEGSLRTMGQLLWSGGELYNEHTSGNMENYGTITLEGGAQKPLNSRYGALSFTNHGTMIHSGLGAFHVNTATGGDTELVNTTGALYDIRTNGTLLTGDAPFCNYGTLRRSAGAGEAILRGDFRNRGGTIEVQVGTLTLEDGTHSGGTFAVSPGAVLDLEGAEGSVYAGRYTDSGSGTIRLSRGYIRCSAAVFSFTSGLRWRGGKIYHGHFSGSVTNEGLVVLEGSEEKTAEAFYGSLTIVNPGTFRQTGAGALRLYGRSGGNLSFNNLAGGLYDIQTDGMALHGSRQFNHSGTFRKSNGSGVSELDVPFRNDGGTVEALSGTLSFSEYTHSDGVIHLQGGDVAFPGFTLSAGRLEGTGTVSVAGTLLSRDIVSPGLSTGLLRVEGDYAQATDGALVIQIGGSAAGREYDSLEVSGSAALAGALTVTCTDGFVPGVGDRFQILAAAGVSGVFGEVNLPPSQGGLTWLVRYHDSGVDVRLASTHDTDGDGLPDVWETDRFGGLDASDGGLDNFDGDPQTDYQEYVSDTHPTNAWSYFALTDVSREPTVRAHFLSSSNRSYSLERAGSLATGPWSWVPGQTNVPGTGTLDWLEDAHMTGEHGFYRIRVTMP